MKLITLALFASLSLTTVACGKKAGPAPAPAAETKPAEKPADPAPAPAAETKAPEMKQADPAPADALPLTCTKYLDAVKACAGAMPEAARGQFIAALDKTKEAWAMVPKDQLEASCKAAWDAGKQAMAGACPDVKWD